MNWEKDRASFIVVIPLAEDRLAPVKVAANFVEVDDAAAANLGGWHGLSFDPAAHHVFRDVLQTQHLSEYRLGAEWSGTEVRDLFHRPRDGEPHYSRLFHGFTL